MGCCSTNCVVVCISILNILLSFPLLKILDWVADGCATNEYWSYGLETHANYTGPADKKYGYWAVGNWFVGSGFMMILFYTFIDICDNASESKWDVCGYGFFSKEVSFGHKALSSCLSSCSGYPILIKALIKVLVFCLMLVANGIFFIMFAYPILFLASCQEWLICLAQFLDDSGYLRDPQSCTARLLVRILPKEYFDGKGVRRKNLETFSDKNIYLLSKKLPLKRGSMVVWKFCEIPQKISMILLAFACLETTGNGKSEDNPVPVYASAIMSFLMIIITIIQFIRLCDVVYRCEVISCKEGCCC